MAPWSRNPDGRRRRDWLRTAVALAALWVTIVVAMAFFESSLIYFPDRYPIGTWNLDAVAHGTGCTIEDCFFEASDGVRLHGWWCRPSAAEAAPGLAPDTVLLWFHGNAGNLSQRAELMLELARLPAQVVIIDYRGYGRSEGRPSERGLYRDGRAAWRYLVEARGVEPSSIVLLGKSLGGAVAVDLAAEVDPSGLIVQSSFCSIPAMAAHHYPFIPSWLIRTEMDSLAKIGRVRCPVMVIHSTDDEVVPYEQGRRLYEAATADKRFLEIPGAGHNETSVVGGQRYLDAIRRFVVQCASRRSGRQ